MFCSLMTINIAEVVPDSFDELEKGKKMLGKGQVKVGEMWRRGKLTFSKKILLAAFSLE